MRTPNNLLTRKNLTKAGAAVAVGAALFTANKLTQEKPNVTPAHFANYGEANAKLANLVKAHGDDYGTTSHKVAGEIHGALQAAEPLIKQHIADSVEQLATEEEKYNSMAKANAKTKIIVSEQKDGAKFYYVTNTDEYGDEVYLNVDVDKNGKACDISYRYEGADGSGRHALEFKQGDNIVAFIGHNSGDPKVDEDIFQSRTVTFNGSEFDEEYNIGAYAGTDLDLVYSYVSEVDTFLGSAHKSVSAGLVAK